MNSYERLFSRMAGGPADRIPNNCIIMGFGAHYIGSTYREFVTDHKVLAEAAIRCHEDFGIDILSAISDPMREAEGYGSKILLPEDAVPYAPESLIKNINDISKIRIPLPESHNRMNDRLLAIRRMAEYSNKNCAVQGWIEGAFAEACDLMGISEMMMTIMTEPDAAKELLEYCTQGAIKFALTQIEAGADIIGIGDAAASLIGPAMYEEYALPYEIKIINAIHIAGCSVRLHICGDINAILQSTLKTGADIIDCDWMVDFEHANKVFGDSASACGNFDPVAVVLEGTPEDVSDAVRKCITGSSVRSIIAAGCEIPVNTPYENLKAISDALELLSMKID